MKDAETNAPPRRSLRWLSPLIGLVLFSGAVWFLSRELKKYRLGAILEHLADISPRHVAIAFALTVLGHLVLVGFDYLGLLYLRRRDVGLRRVALASLVSYVLSHNIGSWSGAPFRFRAYREANLSLLQITTIVAWCGVTFWLGFLLVAGLLSQTVTDTLAEVYALSPWFLRGTGAVFLALLSAYLAWSWRQTGAVKLGKWRLDPPMPGVAVLQILFSATDWILAGSVFYFLFPEGTAVPYVTFLAVFVLAQASGFSSQIPGGLGVFETIFITFLAPYVPAETVLGTLLAYRGLYYILPFCCGVVALGFYEMSRRGKERSA